MNDPKSANCNISVSAAHTLQVIFASPPQVKLNSLLQAGDAGVQRCQAISERRLVFGVKGRLWPRAPVRLHRLHVELGRHEVWQPSAHALRVSLPLCRHTHALSGIQLLQRHQVLGNVVCERPGWILPVLLCYCRPSVWRRVGHCSTVRCIIALKDSETEESLGCFSAVEKHNTLQKVMTMGKLNH